MCVCVCVCVVVSGIQWLTVDLFAMIDHLDGRVGHIAPLVAELMGDLSLSLSLSLSLLSLSLTASL